MVNLVCDFDDCLPRERRLEESHADEVGVEDGCEERVAEQDSANDDASENQNFSIRHYLHGVVIVGWTVVRKLSMTTGDRRTYL